MGIMYQLALVCSIIHIITCKSWWKIIYMRQLCIVLTTCNMCTQTLMHCQPRKFICWWSTWWVWLTNLKHPMLQLLIACNKEFHYFIRHQLIHNMWAQTCQWTGELAIPLLAIWLTRWLVAPLAQRPNATKKPSNLWIIRFMNESSRGKNQMQPRS